MESREPTRTESVDTLIVGAGFAGLYMLHKLKLQGLTAVSYTHLRDHET